MIRSTFSGFSTALSAMQASQKRLNIVGNNLANMNTPGYSRQQLNTSSLGASGPASYYMNGSQVTTGFGISMDSVTQIRDPYLDAQYRAQINKAGYTDAMQTALDSLSNVLDETKISGIRGAFDDIQSTLTNMQDLPNINDSVLESELRSRMEALTNLLNGASKQISDAQKAEFERLEGKGTSENGAVQRVNDILRQVGDLNFQIKKNQSFGQGSLELLDQRNSLLDELSSYLPIEITYYKDSAHSGIVTDASGNPVLDANGNPREKIYDYDANGTIIGKKKWPDDLKVDLVYTKSDGTSERLTLINGTEGKIGQNYGSLSVSPWNPDNPSSTAVTVTAASGTSPAGTTASAAESQFAGGSIQASLDMLGKDGGTASAANDKRGFQYYINQLDTLAREFAETMNNLNIAGGSGPLFVNKSPSGGPINASNIGINPDWVNGTIHVATGGSSPTETILDMLAEMSKAQGGLGNKTFADFMNNVSTTLANDSSANRNSLKTNVTVLNGIQNSRDSISGVSLDEEASNMMAFMSAYSAASRLMTALDEALDTLINGTGRVGR